MGLYLRRSRYLQFFQLPRGLRRCQLSQSIHFLVALFGELVLHAVDFEVPLLVHLGEFFLRLLFRTSCDVCEASYLSVFCRQSSVFLCDVLSRLLLHRTRLLFHGVGTLTQRFVLRCHLLKFSCRFQLVSQIF
jgi:hypothetical protein